MQSNGRASSVIKLSYRIQAKSISTHCKRKHTRCMAQSERVTGYIYSACTLHMNQYTLPYEVRQQSNTNSRALECISNSSTLYVSKQAHTFTCRRNRINMCMLSMLQRITRDARWHVNVDRGQIVLRYRFVVSLWTWCGRMSMLGVGRWGNIYIGTRDAIKPNSSSTPYKKQILKKNSSDSGCG